MEPSSATSPSPHYSLTHSYSLAYNCDLEMSSQCPSTPDRSLDSTANSCDMEASQYTSRPNPSLNLSHESLSPLKEPPDQIETVKPKNSMRFNESHLSEYSEGLRYFYDPAKSNPDFTEPYDFYLSIPKPNGALVWYSDSQLYPHKKAMAKRKKKLSNIAPPKCRESIEVLRIR